MKRSALVPVLLAAAVVRTAGAQASAPAATPAPAPAPVTLSSYRASWLSDRIPVRQGDILTIVVDEQTAAREQVSNTATSNRGLQADLGANVSEAARIGPNKGFSTGLNNNSREVGDASRQGNLTAVLSVRVDSIEPNGIVHIHGSKKVSVDGREQQVSVEGVVRPEDVTPQNTVYSDRIADAVITYKGKKIGPRTGIIGKILSILWP